MTIIDNNKFSSHTFNNEKKIEYRIRIKRFRIYYFKKISD